MNRHGPVVILGVIVCTCLVLLRFPVPAHCGGTDGSDAALRENLLPAQQGDAEAQIFVGYLYETGQGVQKDYTRAAQWYWKAAEQGNAMAQQHIGTMYHLGKGVTQNYILAYMWLDLAARGGNTNARDIRRAVAGKMSPAEIAQAKQMVEEWKLKKK